jgi:6-pyruvoyltetrahydropterin/6-carboxytetrahydropterin synthase
MYTIAVQREFIAQHHLIGGDFGPENTPHSHAYRVEWRLTGEALDRHGFLVDIDLVNAELETVLAGFRDKSLNERPEFRGLNPSIEHLARILCAALRSRLPGVPLHEVAVTIWESPAAWAAFTETISPSGD